MGVFDLLLLFCLVPDLANVWLSFRVGMSCVWYVCTCFAFHVILLFLLRWIGGLP